MTTQTSPVASMGNGQTRHGVVVLAASIMPIMAIISLVPVLPLLEREFASVPGSEFLVPMALTIPALCVALFSPLAGWLSDRMGRKRLLVAALVLYAGFGIVPWFLTDLMLIIASRIPLGLAEAAIMTIATALIGDYFSGERRENWIAIQIATGSIAAIALIAIGGGLGELFGSRGPFLLYLVALPIALAAALILYEPAKPHGDEEARGVRFPFAAVLPLVATTLLAGIVFYTVIVQLGPILQLSGSVSPGVIGLIGAGANLGVAAGSFLFKRFRRNAGPLLLALGFALAAAGYLGAGLSDSLVSISAFAILACVGSGVVLPNMMTWTMRRVPVETRGRGMGLWTGAFFLGQFIAPLVAVALIGAAGGLAPALTLYAAVIAAAALGALLVARSGASRAAHSPLN
ncbi:MFS transporter [Croceicoccus sediminis]|uniref:MFS transporter n=1 Tax=Croceicoccus sediminis TaxID=2571150 RepID=UPI001F0D2565|nr:MFS transporter [Croceicoccus sediminis]